MQAAAARTAPNLQLMAAPVLVGVVLVGAVGGKGARNQSDVGISRMMRNSDITCECAAHERTLTSVLAQLEELFKEQRRATETGILHDPHHAPHRIAGHHMLALATKLESEGQYDEAQRVKEKAYEMCTSAGIFVG